MIHIRKANDRGLGDHGWLKSRHTFSFADYYDVDHMGFHSLRVINEDRIDGGTGFGAHPHRDMEIISYVISGALEHQDSMGNKTTILPGEVQRMSAGTGVVHSEYNKLSDEQTHFLQIWIMPKARGGNPGYGQKSFSSQLESNKLVHVVSPDGGDGSIAINQDAHLYISRLKAEQSLSFAPRPERGVWVQVIKGSLSVNENHLSTGDGAAIQNESQLEFKASQDSEFLIFDLA